MASKFGIGRTATTIAQDNGSTIVTFHATQVVSFNEHFINLRSGGYKTVTTKRRMNEASATFGLDYRVWQTKYDWHVYFQGKKFPFHDRMTLDRHSGECYQWNGEKIAPIELK